MINYKRPKKPHGFPPKKIILLLQRIATKVSSGDELSSREGANKSYGTRAFTGNPLILND